MEHPFNYEITTVASVVVEFALHNRHGEAAQATQPKEAYAL